VNPFLTNTTNSYNNTNFSTFMAICAALQSHSCKASYVMKKKDKSVALRLQENTQSITFHSNVYLWVTSKIIAQQEVRTTAAITRFTLYAGLLTELAHLWSFPLILHAKLKHCYPCKEPYQQQQ